MYGCSHTPCEDSGGKVVVCYFFEDSAFVGTALRAADIHRRVMATLRRLTPGLRSVLASAGFRRDQADELLAAGIKIHH